MSTYIPVQNVNYCILKKYPVKDIRIFAQGGKLAEYFANTVNRVGGKLAEYFANTVNRVV